MSHDATTLGAPASPDSDDSSTRGPLPHYLGRFRIDAQLGQGGMGQVYAGWDPQLQREVAIKTLLHLHPDWIHRFLREARLQAGLSHPGICPVYEVGLDEDSPYIVMRRLHGRPLDEAARGLSLEQILLLLKRSAESVHEAHRQGLVHRDLKPSNIMVETEDDDPLRPVVLDFGLARTVGLDGLTEDGQIVGTPAFMAPEQAEGEVAQLDRRTDVYSLGATLYCLLAGRPPFVGPRTKILLQILQEDPPPLRPRSIPRDVEAIVFRCLEKDPARRYASAQDLALDLGRFLDGAPVKARPVHFWVRWQKRMRRNPVATGIGILSLVLLSLALGWAAFTAHQAELREQTARHLTRQVEKIEAQARYSQLAPLHDIRPDREALSRRLEELKRALKDGDTIDQRAAHYAVGRGYLALDDLEAAEFHLRRAWQDGYREPEAGVALAQTLSRIYRLRSAEAEIIGDWSARRHELDRLQEQYGQLARSILAELDQGDGGSDFLKALFLFHDDRFPEALETLDQGPSIEPWSHEPHHLKGDIHRAWASRLALDGERETALTHLQDARHAYAKALRVAESEPTVYLADAQAAYQYLTTLSSSDSLDPEWRRHAVERLDAASQARPDDGRPYLWKARLNRLSVQRALQRGTDPGEAAQTALEHARQAAQDPATQDAAWQELGRGYWARAKHAMATGADPETDLAATFDTFDRISQEGRNYTFWISLGLAHLAKAQHLTKNPDPRQSHIPRQSHNPQQSSRESPTDSFDAASRAFQQAATHHTTPLNALGNLGVSLFQAAVNTGPDEAVPLLDRAAGVFQNIITHQPDHLVSNFYLGRIYRSLAQGGDPTSGLFDKNWAEKAQRSFEHAESIAPNMFQIPLATGDLLHLRGIHRWEQGLDPTADFDAARAHHQRAMDLNSTHPTPRLNMAWTVYFEAKVELRAGRDPLALLDESERWIESLNRSGEGVGENVSALLCQGSIARLRGEWNQLQGRNPEPYDLKAEKVFTDMSRRFPDYAEAYRSSARLWTRRAQYRISQGLDPREAWQRADEAFQRLGELRTGHAYDLVADAHRQADEARWHHRSGLPDLAIPRAQKALEAVQAGRALRPSWKEAEILEQHLLSLLAQLDASP